MSIDKTYNPITYARDSALRIAFPALAAIAASPQEIFSAGIFIGALAAREAIAHGMRDQVDREIAEFEANPDKSIEGLANG